MAMEGKIKWGRRTMDYGGYVGRECGMLTYT